jgi:hypothetical protein
MRCKKYYRNLFYGLFDMALVNALIVHRVYAKSVGETPKSHADFIIQLHEELLRLTSHDLDEGEARDTTEDIEVVPAQSSAHVPLASAYTISKSGSHSLCKSMDKAPSGLPKYRACKVCSILKTPSTTRFYCPDCSDDRGRVYLCKDIRRVDEGNSVSCFNIWHSVWKNGEQLPDSCGRGQFRLRRSKEEVTTQETAAPCVANDEAASSPTGSVSSPVSFVSMLL